MTAKSAAGRSDDFHRIASSLAHTARDRKLPTGSALSKRKLFDFTPPVYSYSSPADPSDMIELEEEDVWAGVSSSLALNQHTGNSIAWNAGVTSLSGQLTSSNMEFVAPGNGGSDYGGRGAYKSAPVKAPHWSRLEDAFYSRDDQENDRLPPHVIVALQYGSKQMGASSMIEGAGRTLKGRDLSNVRNSVWRQTGFFD